MAWNEVRISALPALGFIILLFPVQIYLGRLTSITNRDQTAVTTQRVHVMSEILTAIKLVKFYAWEKPFEEKINEIRHREMSLIYRGMVIKAINFMVVFTIPVWIALCSLGMYVAIGNKLTAATSFTVLSVYNTLRYPFFMLPLSVKSLAGALTAFGRLNRFLTSDEVEELHILPAPSNNLAFELNHCDFRWDGTEVEGPTLSDITFSAKRGQKIGIIGDVGSGKSSLIAALLGQIRQVGGEKLKIYGTTSYVPQQAWLLNETLRDNILFGLPMDQERYKECIRVASLQRDLTLLVAGDQTEIAERGANLSGGQRQRASLARAIYHDCDIVLLDDPLSAVDQHVGRHIFEECFLKFLKNKTVVIALHQLQYLSQLDYIIMLRQGKIFMQGTFTELMEHQEFAQLINNHVASGEQEEGDDDQQEFDDGLEFIVQVDQPKNDSIQAVDNSKTALLTDSSTFAEKPPIIKTTDSLKKSDSVRNSVRNVIDMFAENNQSNSDDMNGHRPSCRLELTGNNQMTVRSRKAISVVDVQAMIDRAHSTGFSGTDEHNLAALIARNELSVYSEKEFRVSVTAAAADLDHAKTQETIRRRSLYAKATEAELKQIEEANEDDEMKKRGKLVRQDESANAKSAADDYKAYGQAKQGLVITLLICIFFSVVHGIRIGSDYWLRLWVPRVGGYSDSVYIGVYAGFTLAFGIGVLVRGLLFAKISTQKSTLLHENLFYAVLRAPMSFFDSTPLGRILSAFSKHHLHVDDTMPDAIMQMLQYFPLGAAALILSAVLIPWNWGPAIGTVVLAGLLILYSNPAVEVTKALEAISKPPVFAHVTTSLEGLFSIRAYHAQQRFDKINIELVDRNHEAWLAMACAKSFQALYLDILSSIFVYFTSMLVVIARDVPQMDSTAGLALSNALQMLVFVQWTVRFYSDMQAQMSSVSQLVYYSKVESEAPMEIPDRKPPADWPQRGVIEFKNVFLRYHRLGVDVLKDVTFTIHPREKIGIVGRTGSGKSTLLVSLLRIVEVAEGKILIDGVDVSTIGLRDLRTQIAIIPQEPVLFVGTVRSNLDPFHKSNDDEIWRALDAVNLGEVIRAMPGKLDSAVIENGSNFSVGQRQCFCIARAILAKTKVLVLDEATAAIDMATDLLIQNAIKENFAELTVLTIAHRLNTIIESDRVLVMDAGKVLEFDDPSVLLENPEGSFRNLVDQTGEATAKKLKEVADSGREERQKRRENH
ncbi:Multidrug resistance-associated protein 4 [Nowakowskiella sp. JEL0407]|nr:Multidrug resistance-associated protein 4 [Nowakowskiella sp. JEL0407]